MKKSFAQEKPQKAKKKKKGTGKVSLKKGNTKEFLTPG